MATKVAHCITTSTPKWTCNITPCLLWMDSSGVIYITDRGTSHDHRIIIIILDIIITIITRLSYSNNVKELESKMMRVGKKLLRKRINITMMMIMVMTVSCKAHELDQREIKKYLWIYYYVVHDFVLTSIRFTPLSALVPFPSQRARCAVYKEGNINKVGK